MAHSELKAYSSDEEIEESDEEQIMCVCAPLLAPDAAIEPKEDLPAVVSRRCARTPFTAMSARLVRNRPFHVSDPFFLPSRTQRDRATPETVTRDAPGGLPGAPPAEGSHARATTEVAARAERALLATVFVEDLLHARTLARRQGVSARSEGRVI